MINYFITLLQTMVAIEKHLACIAECVVSAPSRFGSGSNYSIATKERKPYE